MPSFLSGSSRPAPPAAAVSPAEELKRERYKRDMQSIFRAAENPATKREEMNKLISRMKIQHTDKPMVQARLNEALKIHLAGGKRPATEAVKQYKGVVACQKLGISAAKGVLCDAETRKPLPIDKQPSMIQQAIDDGKLRRKLVNTRNQKYVQAMRGLFNSAKAGDAAFAAKLKRASTEYGHNAKAAKRFKDAELLHAKVTQRRSNNKRLPQTQPPKKQSKQQTTELQQKQRQARQQMRNAKAREQKQQQLAAKRKKEQAVAAATQSAQTQEKQKEVSQVQTRARTQAARAAQATQASRAKTAQASSKATQASRAKASQASSKATQASKAKAAQASSKAKAAQASSKATQASKAKTAQAFKAKAAQASSKATQASRAKAAQASSKATQASKAKAAQASSKAKTAQASSKATQAFKAKARVTKPPGVRRAGVVKR